MFKRLINHKKIQKMETNLNMLFQQLLPNFAHLVPTHQLSKVEFMDVVKSNYDINNPKTGIFYSSIEQCDFETIRLNNTRDTILFNQ